MRLTVGEPMHAAAIFCKSFSDDFYLLKELVASFNKHVDDKIPMMISVPRKDLDDLSTTVEIGANIRVICDEDYIASPATALPGWKQQQVCKLSVHKIGFAQSYLMIDSDSYFISHVDAGLFKSGSTPNVITSPMFTKYTANNIHLRNLILTGKEMIAEVNRGSIEYFSARLEKIKAYLTAHPETPADKRGSFLPWLFGKEPGEAYQPSQIFHSEILSSLEMLFLDHGITAADAISAIPWEYNWYACFASCLENICFVRSPVIHFASLDAVEHAHQIGITEALLAKQFCAVQMAARHFSLPKFPPADESEGRAVSIGRKVDSNIEAIFREIIKVLRPGLICDVGAGSGGSAMRFKHECPAANVLAFEANPEVPFDLIGLRRTGVVGIPIAIGSDDGFSSFHIVSADWESPVYDWRRGASSLRKRIHETSREIRVRASTLDSAVSAYDLQEQPCALWLDVPGSLDLIMPGAKAAIHNAQVIRVVLDEVRLFYEQPDRRAMLQNLSDAGFIAVAHSVDQSCRQYEMLMVKRSVSQRVVAGVPGLIATE